MNSVINEAIKQIKRLLRNRGYDIKTFEISGNVATNQVKIVTPTSNEHFINLNYFSDEDIANNSEEWKKYKTNMLNCIEL